MKYLWEAPHVHVHVSVLMHVYRHVSGKLGMYGNWE